ncbi:hypothetical protein [Pseudarthrobacter raffinosi]|uniref:hypothetical protein n=1 Tax=Pseudarthrobacter raffinosi TaxID=2953651 RepID=UPI00208E6D6F|nr:hypothetical protein [Pseudarthrobacter sp. MDT3-9]MCO4250676.1 hypothetical protein [Pseudarthrobacter sp. MDT3-9]
MGCPLSLHGRAPFADEVDRLTDPLDEGWVRDSLTWFALLHDVPRWSLEDRVRDGLRMPAHVWKAILNGLGEATPPTEAGTINAPTLILWGAQDGLLSRSDQETPSHPDPRLRAEGVPRNGTSCAVGVPGTSGGRYDGVPQLARLRSGTKPAAAVVIPDDGGRPAGAQLRYPFGLRTYLVAAPASNSA